MIDTILFDLDGTLIWMSQQAFIGSYFAKLTRALAGIGLDAGTAVKAVWAGTGAMLQNDGNKLNRERFWETFSSLMGLSGARLKAVETACDNFYVSEFDTVKSAMTPNSRSAPLVRGLRAKGYAVILATNPLFPECAVATRLRWIGLSPEDFQYITHYGNSTYCKPNPKYYRELFAKIDRAPENCLMAGNNPAEDLSVDALGSKTFLVTDYLENEAGADITAFRRGTFSELEAYLEALPPLR